MDVRKGAGAAERYQAGEDDLACINRLAKRELTADEVEFLTPRGGGQGYTPVSNDELPEEFR